MCWSPGSCLEKRWHSRTRQPGPGSCSWDQNLESDQTSKLFFGFLQLVDDTSSTTICYLAPFFPGVQLHDVFFCPDFVACVSFVGSTGCSIYMGYFDLSDYQFPFFFSD